MEWNLEKGEPMKQEKLLMIPGPTPVHPRIIQALSQPTVSHVSPEMRADLKEALSNLKKIVFCENGEPFIIAGAGTLAMEMALLNTVEKGERFLVLSQGFFGQRMAEIGTCFGFEVEILQSPGGKAVLPEKLRERVSQERYAAVFATHVDTATGACAPVREYGEILKDSDCLYIIDGVCATGGIEERMDGWGVDVILTAAQKCFGAPPGMAVLVFSEKAMKKREKMSSVPAYYADLLRWLPVMKDPVKYFSTPCVNEIRAFSESTRIVLEEGMEMRFQRHKKSAKAVRAAFTELGFSLYTEEAFLADTLSVVLYPENIEDKSFRTALYRNGVVVSGGLGDVEGKVFRMGHMGNLSFSQVLFALEAIEKTLQSLDYRFEPGSGVRRARAVLEERAG